ncbi:MAG: hypothetical protein ACRDYC_12260, partial [Acidimicrobiales bacterium]
FSGDDPIDLADRSGTQADDTTGNIPEGLNVDEMSPDGCPDMAAASASAATPQPRVIGHYPEYVKLAKNLAAKYFNIPMKIWDSMSPEKQWNANRKFGSEAKC